MIYIGNLHKGYENTLQKGLVIRCDRGHSVLCNPFKVSSEEERDDSCNKFQAYFDKKVREKKDVAFMEELRRIYHLALKQDIVLACWCYPKRCHTQTIKAFLEQFLKNEEHKANAKPIKPPYGLDADEQKKLEWLKKKGSTDKSRKATAYNFIQEWRSILQHGDTTARKFVETQRDFCIQNYSSKYADRFLFKAVCVLDQVKSIEKKFSKYFVSDGTIAMSGFHDPKGAGMRYIPYIVIHWKDEKFEPAKVVPDYRELQQQADEWIPEELKSTNMHLYRETREDHSWLEGIQEERAKQAERAEHERLLKQLKNKYKK